MVLKMKIHFIRHGETNWNKQGLMQGHTDVSLNENGIAQANAISELINNLDFSIAYVSPLKRAVETAKIVLKSKAELIVLEEHLKERNYGEFEGKPFEDYRHLNSENPDFTPKGGESKEEFGKRIMKFFNSINNKHNGVVIVAHGGVFNALLRGLFDLNIEELRKNRLANCEHCIIEKTKKEIRLIKNNEVVLSKKLD